MLEAKGLVKNYPVPGGRTLRALDGVDLALQEAETLALVGESGCGKSTLARLLLRLEKPDEGRVTCGGEDINGMDRAGVRRFRRAVQMIFQDPYGSLNPRMNVGEIVGEPLAVHRLAAGKERVETVARLLERVGLDPESAGRYPRQFSGGQRQRPGYADALAVEPRVLVADEPVSALDVSVQAQILNLLDDIKREKGLTLLFISHDLRVVRAVSDRVAVMYLGKIVECATSEDFFAEPRHPYSRVLLAAVPEPDPHKVKRSTPVKGDPPSPVDRPGGCPFHPRCPEAMEKCSAIAPGETIRNGRSVRCHLY